ncbi:hypothetical protein [Streptomyces sp. NBC_01016]|uniref:hypothetical protein n=1 Tax=Streptomyces sp. NBC_01016 TaxID=2903720 RepID=UPI002256A0CD|nr:hypothetical protein [Streptomyces sp. NBC_01016]
MRRVDECRLRQIGHRASIAQKFLVRPGLHGVHGEPGGGIQPDGAGLGPPLGMAETVGRTQQPVDQVPVDAHEWLGIDAPSQRFGHALIGEGDPERPRHENVRTLPGQPVEFVRSHGLAGQRSNELRPHGHRHGARLSQGECAQGRRNIESRCVSGGPGQIEEVLGLQAQRQEPGVGRLPAR